MTALRATAWVTLSPDRAATAPNVMPNAPAYRPIPAAARGFEVLVNVDLTRKDRATFEAFEAAVAALDEVIEIRRMFGLPDYLLRVRTSSLESYETFVSTQLGDVPGVDKLDSHLTMKLIKSPERQIAPPNAGHGT